MALTNLDAEKSLEDALSRGKTLTISCNNGDKVTVGKSTSSGTGFEALRWGKSRLALPSGKPIAWGPRPQDVSYAVVQHCGRGNVNQALSKVASHVSDLKKQLIKLGSTNPELRPHIREILARDVRAGIPNLSRQTVDDWLERMLSSIAENASVEELELSDTYDLEFRNGKLYAKFSFFDLHGIQKLRYGVGVELSMGISQGKSSVTVHVDAVDAETNENSNFKFQVNASGGATIGKVGNDIGKTILSKLR